MLTVWSCWRVRRSPPRAPTAFASSRLPGAWSIDDPAIATVDSGGTVTGLQHGATVLRVAHESLSATRSLQAVPEVVGTWLGEARGVECSRVFGPGPNACREGFVLPLKLVLGQQGPIFGRNAAVISRAADRCRQRQHNTGQRHSIERQTTACVSAARRS